ncbi:MAG: tRNA lysidine(34) synthetase TilS [Chloroflexi bacterium]|nr:tRNA lysidine(34) synthetase TilS [Chloroflexota bacterium]MYF81072.1 tRNA lysidine(34) synthetase TilS [Chloroflexota bacterium]MYI04273.1 tRNA lysidine(34) synthetase TilS [Chloroflexota bacterium]
MTLPTDRRTREVGRTVSRVVVDHLGQGFGQPLVVAVSGGADSSALLCLLADTQSRHGWRIRAAHVDHAIQSSLVRARFREAARKLATAVEVPLDISEVDARAEAERSQDGLEAAARRVRYDALARVAQERGASAVAVAHTLDDQAETVLMHILRGSGLDGLSGMAPLRDMADGLRLVRPMLDVTRAETEAVCRTYAWTPVEDPSNLDQDHTRNRVRMSLLPLMREFNPNVAERLAGLAGSVAADRDLLEMVGGQALSQLCDEHGTIARRSFLSLPGQLQVRVIRAFCRERGVTLSAERTGAALQVIQHGHGVVELPEGGRLSVARGTIALDPGCPPAET